MVAEIRIGKVSGSAQMTTRRSRGSMRSRMTSGSSCRTTSRNGINWSAMATAARTMISAVPRSLHRCSGRRQISRPANPTAKTCMAAPCSAEMDTPTRSRLGRMRPCSLGPKTLRAPTGVSRRIRSRRYEATEPSVQQYRQQQSIHAIVMKKSYASIIARVGGKSKGKMQKSKVRTDLRTFDF